MKEVKPALYELYISLGGVCNLNCKHCSNIEDKKYGFMSKGCLSLLLEGAFNPFLKRVMLAGREPTLHPEFYQMLDLMKDFFNSRGAFVPSPDLPKEVSALVENFEKDATRLYSYLKWKECGVGVIREACIENEIEATQRLPHVIKTFLVTNGHSLLTDLDTLLSETTKLFEAGIQTVLVSTDEAHQEAAIKAGLSIDYNLLRGYASAVLHQTPHPTAEIIKQKLRDNYTRLWESWNGGFILPIGNAGNLSWQERIELSEIKRLSYEKIMELLEKEYRDWVRVRSHAHPHYCEVAGFFKDNRRTHRLKNPENRIHLWRAHIDPELNVHLCSSKTLPPIGNPREFSFNDLYALALENPLYKTLAIEGPQGLARRLTPWSEEEIKERFMERTPCGMCEDIKREYGFEELQQTK